MQTTPRGIRPHIAIFGRRNVGKSSLINAITDQDIALVSSTAGTTADPVYKNIELLPFGPVVLIDTAGLDDVGELGQKRVEASLKVMKKTDLALVVLEPCDSLHQSEKELIEMLNQSRVPFIVVVNKCETAPLSQALKDEIVSCGVEPESVSSLTGEGIHHLKSVSMQQALKGFDSGVIVGDLIKPGQVVVLVVPIDVSAPRGRLILPQVQTIRDLLDASAITVVAKETELRAAIDALKEPPALVVTDSQVIFKVAATVPPGIPFTGFSVLFARYKGDLKAYINGIAVLEKVGPKARILIAESCTHHQMEDDIGRVKLPKWLRAKYGDGVTFDFCQGVSFPANLDSYDLVIQCGGCMTNRRDILARIDACQKAGVAVTNYGIVISHLHGVLAEAIKPFGLEIK
ncbi:MAG: [FeFe] hydrogenase H-cluster maturation GTPase HydF [Erysipelotrichia bacterium]|nr:[FeFe] hydrogenase H-cluster maturation GTPase HydF [Erysipelotrichia bacterium]